MALCLRGKLSPHPGGGGDAAVKRRKARHGHGSARVFRPDLHAVAGRNAPAERRVRPEPPRVFLVNPVEFAEQHDRRGLAAKRRLPRLPLLSGQRAAQRGKRDGRSARLRGQQELSIDGKAQHGQGRSAAAQLGLEGSAALCRPVRGDMIAASGNELVKARPSPARAMPEADRVLPAAALQRVKAPVREVKPARPVPFWVCHGQLAAVTVTVQLAVASPHRNVTVAVPGATPVTVPSSETVQIAGLEDSQSCASRIPSPG